MHVVGRAVRVLGEEPHGGFLGTEAEAERHQKRKKEKLFHDLL
jgi:hypothetical protein